MSTIKISYEEGYLYADDQGNKVEYPEYCDKTVKKIQRLERQAARQQSGSNNNKATLMRLADRKRALSAQIRSFTGKVSNDLLSAYDHVITEPAEGEGNKEGINYLAGYRALCRCIREKQR